jgi:hypothetical protein
MRLRQLVSGQLVSGQLVSVDLLTAHPWLAPAVWELTLHVGGALLRTYM